MCRPTCQFQKWHILLNPVLLLHWTGAVTSNINTLPGATHCNANGQHGSMTERHNIGQLMFTYHYCDLKLSHSGDIQPNPELVSSELQGHASSAASVLASAMPRGLKIGEWNVQSLYNKIEQMRQDIDASGSNIHILGGCVYFFSKSLQCVIIIN